MPTDRSAGSWPETTYHGFSGPTPRPDPPRRRRWPWVLSMGTAAAIVLGVGAGFLVRPNLDNTDAAETKAPGVPIEVAKPPPPEPVHSDGKLEVLSPEQAAAARAQAPQLVPSPQPAAIQPPAASPATVYAPPPPPPLPRVTGGAPLAVPPPQQGMTARGPCAAGSPAEQMVCADPQLAEADRDLNRAYRRALAAGVPAGFLRSEQRDWLGVREEAARRSPRALANVYAQRIDDLNAMADDARRDRGGDDEDDGPGF